MYVEGERDGGKCGPDQIYHIKLKAIEKMDVASSCDPGRMSMVLESVFARIQARECDGYQYVKDPCGRCSFYTNEGKVMEVEKGQQCAVSKMSRLPSLGKSLGDIELYLGSAEEAATARVGDMYLGSDSAKQAAIEEAINAEIDAVAATLPAVGSPSAISTDVAELKAHRQGGAVQARPWLESTQFQILIVKRITVLLP